MTNLEITSIQSAQLQTIAKNVDTNNDGRLNKEEFNLFAQEATKAGVDYKTISETLDLNGFQRWIYDVDKVCTDGQDDGKLNLGEKMESFGKGLFGLIKASIKNPIATAATVGVGIAIGALAGPVVVAGIGLACGLGMLGVGAYKASKANNDGDAKRAWETIGTGAITTALSGVAMAKTIKPAQKITTENSNMHEVTLADGSKQTTHVIKTDQGVKTTITTEGNGVQSSQTIVQQNNGGQLSINKVTKPDGTVLKYAVADNYVMPNGNVVRGNFGTPIELPTPARVVNTWLNNTKNYIYVQDGIVQGQKVAGYNY